MTRMVKLNPARVRELDTMHARHAKTEMTLQEHFEAFWRAYWNAAPIPPRGTPAYTAAYEQWVTWAFGDLHGTNPTEPPPVRLAGFDLETGAMLAP